MTKETNNIGHPAIAPLSAPTVVKLCSIKPASDNPRNISSRAVEVTANSIKRFGWQQPIVVDRNNIILAGHTRFQAAKHLGLTEVPVVVASNLTDDEAQAYRIADNRTGDFTTWDYPELVSQLEELADDFSEELALADWEGIIEEFEARESGEDLTLLDLSEESDATLNTTHSLTVVCASDSAMAEIQGLLADHEGVLDVRIKR